MKTLNLILSAAITLLLLTTASALADEKAKLSPADREAVLAKLKTNKVSLGGLTIEPKDGGPAINLGTGLDGGEANNANDDNLRQIAQLPEVERVMVYKGKITADGLAALAALPKLRYLQMYATDIPAAAFAVLPKLTLFALSFASTASRSAGDSFAFSSASVEVLANRSRVMAADRIRFRVFMLGLSCVFPVGGLLTTLLN